MPRVDGGVVRRILDHRVRVATESVYRIENVFEPEASDRLAQWYDEHADVSIRSAIRVAGDALVEAVEAATDRITVGAIENALALS